MADRRKFIKDSCTTCVGLLAFSSLASLLSSCSALPVYSTSVNDNIIRIPLDSILPDEKMKIIRSKTLAYDILLVLKEDKKHISLLMRCTHQDNILVATQKGMTCNLHGSTFNLNGDVTKGPASRPLQKLKTIEENQHITIYLS